MFGLVRFAMSLLMLAAFVWFAVTIPLGKRTLWGHVHAIFATQEAKDLADGTKEEAEKVARKVKDELQRPDMKREGEAAPAKAAPTAHEGSAPAKQHRVKVPLN
jgi:hypothetical protein